MSLSQQKVSGDDKKLPVKSMSLNSKLLLIALTSSTYFQIHVGISCQERA